MAGTAMAGTAMAGTTVVGVRLMRRGVRGRTALGCVTRAQPWPALRVLLCNKRACSGGHVPGKVHGKLTGNKVFASAAKAVSDIKAGSTLLVGGFGLSGVPEALLRALQARGVGNLTVVSSNVGTKDRGLGLLFESRQVSKVIGSYVGENETFERQFLEGEIEVELVPMGTLAERMRAAGAGIPAFYTRTGSGTLVQHGGMPCRYAADGSRRPLLESRPKESRWFAVPNAGYRGGAGAGAGAGDGDGGDDGGGGGGGGGDGGSGLGDAGGGVVSSEYVLEEALGGDYAFVKAWKGDTEGNLVYRKTARNHNPAIATAGRVTIAEVEELVSAGEIEPDAVHTPGVYVQRVVQAERMGVIERLTLADDASSAFSPSTSAADALRERIVRRAALELRSGDYVNLGIGMPTLVSNYIPPTVKITLQSENGMLGVGPFPKRGKEDCDLINAGKQTVTELAGASYFGADQSFAMIRGGHCQVTVLGSMQVAANGDMANYLIPGKLVKGMGGAMDLVSSGSRVIVTMEHTDKKGNSKVLPRCTLPLTGRGVVSTLITEKAVFDVIDETLVLREIGEGETVESVRAATAADFVVADDVGPMRQ